MLEHYFLLVIGFAAVFFAAVQDVRTREIANWLTFSLIAFVLAYRGFYSFFSGDFSFFLYGLGGVLLFTALGYLFYCLGVFAGGDAKLLFGLGGIFLYNSLSDYIFYGFGFFFLLFSLGVIYTLIYSAFFAGKNIRAFKKAFLYEFKKGKVWIFLAFLFVVLFVFIDSSFIRFSWIFLLLPLIYFYAKSIESSCMIKLTSPEKLTEGDWLVEDVKVGKKVILKTVHGLSYEDILFLRKNRKSVLIKSGVPFAPVFLIALIVFYSWYPSF